MALPKRTSLGLQFYRHHRYWPDLRNPRTFSEKIQYRKLHDRDPRLSLCSDKVLVKDYVAERLGSEWVTPTLWSGKSLPPREERTWPFPYVIKANHGQGTNIFVRSAEDADWPAIERETRRWLKARYRPHLREEHYHRIEPQLLVEPYVGAASALPVDYKFFVFHGRVAFATAQVERETGMRIQMYCREGEPLSCSYYRGRPAAVPPKPASFRRMIEAAETLGADFSFVRADFYEIDGEPRFGEMTFMPGSGYRRFDPPEYNRVYGDLWSVAAMGERPPVTSLVPGLRPALEA